MVVITNVIVSFLCVYYTLHIIKLLFPKGRKYQQTRNKELNKLRTIPIKTLEEQKKFLDLKHGKLKGKQKWSWKKLPNMILYLVIFVALLRGYIYVFDYFDLIFSLFWTIVIVIIGPALINLLLKKFNVETDDITVFFRGSKNK